jgi:ABC-type glycerol-3-phosphate transport system substrate-binding protein
MIDTGLDRRQFLTVLGGSAAYIRFGALRNNPDTGTASVAEATVGLDEEQSIEVFDYDPTGSDAAVAADREFEAYFKEKYPTITVNRTVAGFAGFAEQLLTSVAGGAKYDVIYGWPPWLPQFIENEVVSALDPFLENEPDLSADDFYDYGKDVAGGKIYGLSWVAEAQFFFNNKTALAAAGLDDPAELDAAGEWTYDTFRQLAQDASSAGDRPIYGFDMSFTRVSGVFSAFSGDGAPTRDPAGSPTSATTTPTSWDPAAPTPLAAGPGTRSAPSPTRPTIYTSSQVQAASRRARTSSP